MPGSIKRRTPAEKQAIAAEYLDARGKGNGLAEAVLKKHGIKSRSLVDYWLTHPTKKDYSPAAIARRIDEARAARTPQQIAAVAKKYDVTTERVKTWRAGRGLTLTATPAAPAPEPQPGGKRPRTVLDDLVARTIVDDIQQRGFTVSAACTKQRVAMGTFYRWADRNGVNVRTRTVLHSRSPKAQASEGPQVVLEAANAALDAANGHAHPVSGDVMEMVTEFLRRLKNLGVEVVSIRVENGKIKILQSTEGTM